MKGRKKLIVNLSSREEGTGRSGCGEVEDRRNITRKNEQQPEIRLEKRRKAYGEKGDWLP